MACSLIVDTTGLVGRGAAGEAGVNGDVDASAVDASPADASPADATTDAPVGVDAHDAGPMCDPTRPFGPRKALSELTVGTDGWPRLTWDERIVTFHARASASIDVYIATRSNRTDPFDAPRPVTALNSPFSDYDPDLSADGLTIAYAPVLGDGGLQHILTATRPTVDAAFGAPQRATVLDGTSDDIQPFLTLDGTEIWFSSARLDGTYDRIYRAARDSSGAFGPPVLVGELGTSTSDSDLPVLSADGLTIYFESDRSGGKGGGDIWTATRPTKSSPFGPPTNVTELNSALEEGPTWLSPDNCRLYLGGDPVNGYDMWVAERSP
jgi:Tol biopolymer transport system component